MKTRLSFLLRVGSAALLLIYLSSLPSCASSDSQADSTTPWTGAPAPQTDSAMASIIPQSR